MNAELIVLALAALLQVVQYGLMAVPANRELGSGVTMGPRDDPRVFERLSARTARLKRALANHVEALVLFTVAVVLVVLGESASALTAVCAWLYLGARIAYVPAYAFGWSPWRSIFWTIGFLATIVMIVAALAEMLT